LIHITRIRRHFTIWNKQLKRDMPDLNLPPRCIRNLRSSEMLRSVDW